MAARRRLGILQSCPAVLQSRLGILQFCLSILQSRPVSPQSSPRRSSVLALNFDQLRAPFTEPTRRQRRSLTRPSRDRPRCYRRSPSRPSPDCSAAAAEVSRIFCGICPVEAVCSLQKQKSRHFATFCDYGLPSIPKKRNRTATQLDHLRFCVSIRNWKVLNNPQSQKSCTASRFLFLSPRRWLQDESGASREDNDASGGRLGPGDTFGTVPRTGDARWPRAVPAKRPATILQKQKARASGSDALALFSNDVAPTLALTLYPRTQVPSSDRIPRLYA